MVNWRSDGQTCTSCLPRRLSRCRNIKPNSSPGTSDKNQNCQDFTGPTDDDSRSIVADNFTVEDVRDNIEVSLDDEDVGEYNIEDVLPSYPLAHSSDFKCGEMYGMDGK